MSFDSETYQKEMVEVGVREFYQEMVDHPTVFPKTSMPSVHDYYEAVSYTHLVQIGNFIPMMNITTKSTIATIAFITSFILLPRCFWITPKITATTINNMEIEAAAELA